MPRVRAVLFDRDDTLIEDVPYNGDPDLVVPQPGARLALDLLRSVGILTAVISNQSGVGRGLITLEQVRSVNRRVESLLGPLGPWLVCPHCPEDACGCRKPAAGLILQAADALGVHPSQCAVVGDKASDMEAALRAGALGIMVARAGSEAHDEAKPWPVVDSLLQAVELVLSERTTVKPPGWLDPPV